MKKAAVYHTKAQIGSLIKIILLAVAFILLLALTYLFFVKANNQGNVEACKLNVLAQDTTKTPGLTGTGSGLSLTKCNKNYVYFSDTKVETGWDPDSVKASEVFYNGKKVKRFAELNDYIVNQVIAEEMRKCFYQMGEGKVAVFNSNVFKSQNVCFVCSEIVFRPDVPQDTEFVGFIEYLKKTSYDAKGSKLSYYEYFDQPGISNISWSSVMPLIMDEHSTIKPDQTYSVIFTKQDTRMKKTLENIAKTIEVTGAVAIIFPPATAAAASVGAGQVAANFVAMYVKSIFTEKDENVNYYVYFVPTESLDVICDLQAS